MKELLADAWYQLDQWGVWVRVGNAPAYTSPGFALLRDNVQQASSRTPLLITDTQALRIDRAVAQLIKRAPDMGCAVKQYFVYQASYGVIAQELGLPNRKNAATLVEAGVAWLDAWLVMQDSLIA